MFSIAAQNRTLFGVAPFTPRCYSWRVCPTSDSPPDGVPEGRLQEDEAQRCAAEGKARCTFFGLSENEQILEPPNNLAYLWLLWELPKHAKRNSKPALYTQAMCKYFSSIKDSGNYSGGKEHF